MSSTNSASAGKRFRIERRGGGTATTANWRPLSRPGFTVVGRGMDAAAESLYEKQVVMPIIGNGSPRDHAWAVARFSCDIMAEHALFFSLLMPPEVAKDERLQAIQFHREFQKKCHRLDAKGPPTAGELRGFVRTLAKDFQPIIDYKRDSHRGQVSGALQSLVWPLFFDHTLREAERWVRRLEDIGGGNVALDRREVVGFWGGVVDDHFRFIAHLLDPDEHVLVRKAYRNSASFQAIRGGPQRSSALLGQAPAEPMGDDPAAILAMASEVLEFKTDAVRKLEAGKIRSIISPILADHVRREAAWFVDELKRLEG